MVNIKQLMFDYSITQRQMAEIINCTQSEVSFFCNGKRRLGARHIEALTDYFGEDVLASYREQKLPPQTASATVTILSPETVDDIKAEIAEAETFPILPEEVSIKPNIDIREYIEESGNELEHINPNQMLRRADMAERILRTSMMPTFQPEDIVFVRFLQDKMKIVDGDIYYIDSKSRPTMIRQVKFTEEGKLRLIAQNPQYGDIIMDRSEVLNIATIVGLLRMNFSDQYSEIEAVRRHKDEQIVRRDEQMDRFIDMQSRLVSELCEQGRRADKDRERIDSLVDKLINK